MFSLWLDWVLSRCLSDLCRSGWTQETFQVVRPWSMLWGPGCDRTRDFLKLEEDTPRGCWKVRFERHMSQQPKLSSDSQGWEKWTMEIEVRGFDKLWWQIEMKLDLKPEFVNDQVQITWLTSSPRFSLNHYLSSSMEWLDRGWLSRVEVEDRLCVLEGSNESDGGGESFVASESRDRCRMISDSIENLIFWLEIGFFFF